jgi:hypothetical protein|tara:strand:+ start:258 stop:422 length:165 start_codon:yes stop_codon:yes gene_type:complete
MKLKKESKKKIQGYKDLADCIKMGQVSSDRVQKHFVKDPQFEKWYLNTMIKKTI